MHKGYPEREKAEALLAEAELLNPGPWGDHSRIAARCAQSIAQACEDMDGEKAYILGLLHDIGRRFGVKHLGHVYDGYKYMLSLGFEEAARICLTHSFHTKDIGVYIGKFDISAEQQQELEAALAETEFDDYDRLIQLCDALAGSEGVLDVEERMSEVKRRYGFYPQEKWDANIALLRYFGDKTGVNIYTLVC